MRHVFAYGSLMGDAILGRYVARPARLEGLHRAFVHVSRKRWGSPESPCPILGLTPGGECWGLAFEVPDADERTVLRALERREAAVERRCETRATDTPGGSVDCWVWVSRDADGREPEASSVEERLRSARGVVGTGVEYVRTVAHAMELHGIRVFLYITAEDVFGSDAPRRRGPQPLHTIPETVAGLYDLGLRHHLRDAAMVWWTNDELERQPDWKVDRLAIRMALCGRERLGLEPGGRVAVFGRLGWLWPVLEFAAMGFGLVPVGLEHDLGDDALCAAMDEAAARVAFATDALSASRLLGLIRGGRLRGVTLVAEGAAEEDAVLPLERLLDLGSTFDTPERAQAFRAFSRQVSPDADALWHVTSGGTRRLTHRLAMEGIAESLRARPAQAGDVAYLEAPRVSLAVRCAYARFVGDGLTTTAFGREGRTREDIADLRPHKALACGSWLERAIAAAGPRWPGGLDRLWARRRILEALGGRLRWIESEGGVPESARRGLALARVSMYNPGHVGG